MCGCILGFAVSCWLVIHLLQYTIEESSIGRLLNFIRVPNKANYYNLDLNKKAPTGQECVQ